MSHINERAEHLKRNENEKLQEWWVTAIARESNCDGHVLLTSYFVNQWENSVSVFHYKCSFKGEKS